MIYKIIVDKQPLTNPSNEKKEYQINIEELRYKGDVFDSLVITIDEDYVMRRLELSEYGVLSVLENPIKQPLNDINIELFEGDNYIYLYDMLGNKIVAEYLVKNEFNELYVTKSEMRSNINQSATAIELSVYRQIERVDGDIEEANSKITQTADAITAEVTRATNAETTLSSTITQTAEGISTEVAKKVGKDEVISRINQSAEAVTINANKIGLSANDVLDIISGNALNLTSKNITIASTNFNVDKNGNMSCANATITGGDILLNANGNNVIKVQKNNSTNTMAYISNNVFGINNNNDHVECYCMSNPSVDVYREGVSGTYITHEGITTPVVTQTSREEEKKDFEKLENGLDIIKDVDIYKYHLKLQEDNDKKHIGFVIGDDFKYREEITSNKNDGVDIYSFVSVCCKAIQEQQEQIEELKQKIENLEKGDK